MTVVVKVSDQAGGNTKQMGKHWKMSIQESVSLFAVHTEYHYRGL
jgi:hypothetical protein